MRPAHCSPRGCLPSALGARVRISGGKLTVTMAVHRGQGSDRGFASSSNSKAEAIEMTKNFLQVAGDGECELRQVYEAGQSTCADAAATR